MPRSLTPAIAITALLAGAILTTTPASVAPAAAPASPAGGVRSATSCTSWQVVTAPQPPGFAGPPALAAGSAADQLYGVSVLSSKDVWIGATSGTAVQTPQSWFVHWNGQAAATAPAPSYLVHSRERTVGAPYSTSFDSDSDGWQVVANSDGNMSDGPLSIADHWHNGQWALTPMAVSPDPQTLGVRVDALAAVSPDDAWAVGGLFDIAAIFGVSSEGALIEHWDGTQWSIVPAPTLSQPGADLTSINVDSANDIWATGWQGTDGGSPSSWTPLVEHYNGSTWTAMTVPTGTTPSYFSGISADSPNDAWAVGYQAATSVGYSITGSPLIEHWDGTSWTVASLPASVAALHGLNSVYAVSPNNVWATESGSTASAQFFVHWDGRTWSTVPAPGPTAYGLASVYNAISGDHAGDVWAVGDEYAGYTGNYTPLVTRLNCAGGAR